MGSRPPPAPAGRIVPRSSIARYRRRDLETVPNSPGSGGDRNSSARAALTQQARLRRHRGSRGCPRRPPCCIAGDEVEANGHPIPHDRWAPGASRLTPRPAGRPPHFRACSSTTWTRCSPTRRSPATRRTARTSTPGYAGCRLPDDAMRGCTGSGVDRDGMSRRARPEPPPGWWMLFYSQMPQQRFAPSTVTQARPASHVASDVHVVSRQAVVSVQTGAPDTSGRHRV